VSDWAFLIKVNTDFGRSGGEALDHACNQGFLRLILPPPREPRWRELGIPHCVLDIPPPYAKLGRSVRYGEGAILVRGEQK